MRHRITNSKRRLVMGVIGLCLLVAGVALAETASRAMTITEVYTAARPSRGVEETKTTTFERNKGYIFCYVRIDNPSGNGNEIYVAFEEDSGTPTNGAKGIKLRVPPRYRYRTVARTGSNMPAGSYNCVVRSREGEVLEHTGFQVTE